MEKSDNLTLTLTDTCRSISGDYLLQTLDEIDSLIEYYSKNPSQDISSYKVLELLRESINCKNYEEFSDSFEKIFLYCDSLKRFKEYEINGEEDRKYDDNKLFQEMKVVYTRTHADIGEIEYEEYDENDLFNHCTRLSIELSELKDKHGEELFRKKFFKKFFNVLRDTNKEVLTNHLNEKEKVILSSSLAFFDCEKLVDNSKGYNKKEGRG